MSIKTLETAIGSYQIYMDPAIDAYRIASSMCFSGPIYDSRNSHKRTNIKNKKNKKKII